LKKLVHNFKMFFHPHHPQAPYRNNSGTVKKLCEIISPKFDEDSIPSYGMCHVKQMTCEQTSLWVRTFCRHKGWDEADSYAEKFKGQWVLGRHLEVLTDFYLKEYLEIKNCLHRKELLSAISYLFSGSIVLESKADSEALASAYTQVLPPKIVYHGLSLAGSLFSAPFTHSSVAGYSESESSILQNRYVPCSKSYCPSASAASYVGSYTTDMAQWVQTDMSDMVSDSSQTGFMNVEGPSMPSKNEGYAMMGMHQLPDLSRPQRLREPVSTRKNGSDNPKKTTSYSST